MKAAKRPTPWSISCMRVNQSKVSCLPASPVSQPPAGASEDWAVAPITCPVRFVWGTEDKLLPWPDAARRYQREMPHADWVVLDGVGHCPQLELPLEAAELVLT